jgi:peptidoglycan/xylan/chitin deacetylase (PgdA/CDA1 family)
VDTLDWKYRNSTRTCNQIKNRAVDGSIVLLHDLHSTTVTGAMKALKQMQDGDYEFLTVTELLSRNGRAPKPNCSYSKG